MSIKVKPIEVPAEDPYKNDRLGRSKCGKMMTDIVNDCSDGGVIALNGAWGTGKSIFVNMWSKELQKKGYKVISFNAWESDNVSDPLIALVGELYAAGLFDGQNGKELMDATWNVTVTFMCSIAKQVIKSKTGVDIDETIEATKKGFKQQLENYNKEKAPMQMFRKALTTLVNGRNGGHPIVFIIDELDRTAPSFAVKLLERVKHLLDIPNIVFVLAVDKKQLGNAVRGYYGSDLIDADEYLRRFIDIEYNLPEPDYGVFCDVLRQRLSLEECFNNNEDDRDWWGSLKIIAQAIAEKEKLTLRQLERMFIAVRFAFRSGSHDADLYFILIYLRMSNVDFYNDIKNKKISLQKFVDCFENQFGMCLEDEKLYPVCHGGFHYRFAQLVMAYNNRNIKQPLSRKEFEKLVVGNSLVFYTKIANAEWLMENLEMLDGTGRLVNLGIDEYIEHVELISGLL